MKSTRGFETPLYFEMPSQFNGDHLLSYGGLFTFAIEMMECETGFDQITVQQFPLIRINAHNSLNLDYFGVRFTNHQINLIGIYKNNMFLFWNLSARIISHRFKCHTNDTTDRSALAVAFQR